MVLPRCELYRLRPRARLSDPCAGDHGRQPWRGPFFVNPRLCEGPNTGRLPTMRQLAPRSPKRVLISDAIGGPKRFELLTPRFVVRGTCAPQSAMITL